jgi:hypothetical protein
MLNGTAKETEGSWVIQYYNELVDIGNQVPASLKIIIQVYDFIHGMLDTLIGAHVWIQGFTVIWNTIPKLY